MQEQTKPVSVEKSWRWYHGMFIYLVAQCLSFSLNGLVRLRRQPRPESLHEIFIPDASYFRSLKQLPITPPAWAFGPAWTINNILTIWSNLRVLNQPDQTPGRIEYIALQSGSWLVYILFSAAYFGLHSPINALVLTFLMLLLTIASILVSLFRLRDTKAALLLTTLFLWLLIALSAATGQVIYNKDDFYQKTLPHSLAQRKNTFRR